MPSSFSERIVRAISVPDAHLNVQPKAQGRFRLNSVIFNFPSVSDSDSVGEDILAFFLVEEGGADITLDDSTVIDRYSGCAYISEYDRVAL